MRDKERIILLISVILALLALGVRVNPGEVVRVNLDEVVSLGLFGASESIELVFSPTPSFALSELPHCPDKLLYGALALGNAGKRIPVVLCEAQEGPYLWLDTDGDGELEGGRWHWRGGWQEFGWLFTVLVDYIEGDQHYKVLYPIRISVAPELGRDPGELFYYYSLLPGGYRKGLIELDMERIAIALFDLNMDGRYDDVKNLGIAVDADLDGEFCFYCAHEAWGLLAPSPEEPLRIGGKAYALAQASPSGKWIELQVLEDELPAVPFLLPGHSFPELTGRTLWGEDFTLASLRGQVVALFFLAQTLCTLCAERPSGCAIDGCWAICSRPLEVAKLLADLRIPNVEVVVALTEDEPPALQEWEELKLLGVPVLWSPWVPTEYRIGQGFFLIDPEGVIGYTDEVVISFLGDESAHRMRFNAEFANTSHVLWGIERLLEKAGIR